MDSLIVLFWATLGSVFSLIGGIALVKFKVLRKRFALFALPFGAGALLAASFFDLLPEALEDQDIETMLRWVLGGFLAFFLFERLVTWFHRHHDHESRNRTQRTMIIVGDTLHNAIDGVAIGIAFLIDVPTGIVTALAVAAHEIPQEIGDFGLLLGKGMKPTKVIIVNLLSAVATIVTAMATFWLGGAAHFPEAALLAITAGFFIYIAASDIIPDIHEQPRKIGTIQAAMLLVGILIIGLVIELLHAH